MQDVVTCIREHRTLATAGRLLAPNGERHFKPAEEMARLFRDFPEAVAESHAVFERLAFSLDELSYQYPDEPTGTAATPQEALVALTEAGARIRFPSGVPAKIRDILDHELDLIGRLRFAAYFLTVHDIIRFARSHGILCQGRGSAANSAVCYCLGITEVNPETCGLLFERFISEERGEPPDIDVDFEHERREEVMQYIYNKYGRERAGLAATVITYRSRSAVREVGKVFGLSEDAVGALSGTVWGWSSGGVRGEDVRRIGMDPEEKTMAEVMAYAKEIGGFPRHLSQHVGGFVMTRDRLDEVVPDHERGDGGPHHRRVGQGRPRRPRHPQGRYPGAGHALLHPPGLRFLRAHYGVRPDARLDPGRGPRRLPHAAEGRFGRRLPGREPRPDVHAAAPQAGEILRSRHRGGDRPPRPHPGRHGASLSPPPLGYRDGGLSGATRLRPKTSSRRCSARHWACRSSRSRR